MYLHNVVEEMKKSIEQKFWLSMIKLNDGCSTYSNLLFDIHHIHFEYHYAAQKNHAMIRVVDKENKNILVNNQQSGIDESMEYVRKYLNWFVI